MIFQIFGIIILLGIVFMFVTEMVIGAKFLNTNICTSNKLQIWLVINGMIGMLIITGCSFLVSIDDQKHYYTYFAVLVITGISHVCLIVSIILGIIIYQDCELSSFAKDYSLVMMIAELIYIFLVLPVFCRANKYFDLF